MIDQRLKVTSHIKLTENIIQLVVVGDLAEVVETAANVEG